MFSWVFSGYLLTQTVTIPVQAGRPVAAAEPVLIGGTLVFLAGSALCASSWDIVSLIAFRNTAGHRRRRGPGHREHPRRSTCSPWKNARPGAGWLSSVWGISAWPPGAGAARSPSIASWRWIFLINLPVGQARWACCCFATCTRTCAAPGTGSTWPGRWPCSRPAAPSSSACSRRRAWPWWSAPSLTVFGIAVMAAVARGVHRAPGSRADHAAVVLAPPVLGGSALAALGLGLLVIGPTTFLPTYGQAVLGLGAVAAGALLGTGAEHQAGRWPRPSPPGCSCAPGSVTPRAGGGGDLPGGGGRLPVERRPGASVGTRGGDLRPRRRPGPAVGGLHRRAASSTVAWGQRGVVTGTVMFCRLPRPEPGRGDFRCQCSTPR